MYGVVEVAGRQYRVSPGDIIDVNRLEIEEGGSVELDKVLFIGGDGPVVGLPQVEGAKVTAKVIRQARSRKLIVFKRKPGLWRKKRGHRQHYTGLLITDIDDGKGNKASIDQESKAAKKYLAGK